MVYYFECRKSKGNILHPDLIIRFKVIGREYKGVLIRNIDEYVDDRLRRFTEEKTRIRYRLKLDLC